MDKFNEWLLKKYPYIDAVKHTLGELPEQMLIGYMMEYCLENNLQMEYAILGNTTIQYIYDRYENVIEGNNAH